MPRWKLQAVEPDTCDPPGCRYIEMYDVLVRPHVLTVVAFDRVCPGHAASVPADVMLWQDGNWKDKKAYDAKALELAKRFDENFKQFEDMASDDVKAVGPNV